MNAPIRQHSNPPATSDAAQAVYSSDAPLVVLARTVIAQLLHRESFFPDATFEDPQWLMMLELFIASEERRDVTVSSLCFAAAVPATTALRHIRNLCAKGIFERRSHPRDRRISHVRLSDASRRQMMRYLVCLASGDLEIEDGAALRAAH